MSEETTKTPKNPTRRAAKILARALWMQEFKAENAEASKEDIAKAWEAVKATRVEQMNKAVKALGRNGFELTVKDAESAE